MDRRKLLQGIGFAATTGIAGLAGCLGGGGPEGEVVKNELSDTIEVNSHRIENAQVMGTDAVSVIATVKNVGDSATTVHFDAKLYDGDTIVAHDEYTVDEKVDAGIKKEISESYEGRVKNVSRYEISIFEESGTN